MYYSQPPPPKKTWSDELSYTKTEGSRQVRVQGFSSGRSQAVCFSLISASRGPTSRGGRGTKDVVYEIFYHNTRATLEYLPVVVVRVENLSGVGRVLLSHHRRRPPGARRRRSHGITPRPAGRHLRNPLRRHSHLRLRAHRWRRHRWRQPPPPRGLWRPPPSPAAAPGGVLAVSPGTAVAPVMNVAVIVAPGSRVSRRLWGVHSTAAAADATATATAARWGRGSLREAVVRVGGGREVVVTNAAAVRRARLAIAAVGGGARPSSSRGAPCSLAGIGGGGHVNGIFPALLLARRCRLLRARKTHTTTGFRMFILAIMKALGARMQRRIIHRYQGVYQSLHALVTTRYHAVQPTSDGEPGDGITNACRTETHRSVIITTPSNPPKHIPGTNALAGTAPLRPVIYSPATPSSDSM